jgi:manganese peroxidase
MLTVCHFAPIPDDIIEPFTGGIDDIADPQIPFIAKYNMTAGDFVQFAGAISISLCAGAPRLDFFLGCHRGRRRPHRPGVVDTADTIPTRFDDAGAFTPSEAVALLASYSIAAADYVDLSMPGPPFNSTPGVFDTQFLIDTQLRGTLSPGMSSNPGEVVSPLQGGIPLQSDLELARNSHTTCEW